MKTVFFIPVFLLIFVESLFCAAPDKRICDCDGDCAEISAAGELMISSINEGPRTAGSPCQADRRISDNDGDVAQITSTGLLQA